MAAWRTLIFEMHDGRKFQIFTETDGDKVHKKLFEYKVPLNIFQMANLVVDAATRRVLKNRYDILKTHEEICQFVDDTRELPYLTDEDLDEWRFEPKYTWPGNIRIS